jgi:hypothetical protein
VALGKGAVVQVSQLGEPGDRRFDLLFPIPPAAELAANLGPRVGPARQEVQA